MEKEERGRKRQLRVGRRTATVSLKSARWGIQMIKAADGAHNTGNQRERGDVQGSSQAAATEQINNNAGVKNTELTHRGANATDTHSILLTGFTALLVELRLHPAHGEILWGQRQSPVAEKASIRMRPQSVRNSGGPAQCFHVPGVVLERTLAHDQGIVSAARSSCSSALGLAPHGTRPPTAAAARRAQDSA